MPVVDMPGTTVDRACFRDALADTHARGRGLLEGFREQREHYVRASESLAVERRILRDDLAHWNDESA